MTRLVFDSVEQLREWTNRHVTKGYYECFITTLDEVIFAPTKSTKTLRHGYMRFADKKILEVFVEATQEGLGLDVFKIKSYDWASDRTVGAGYTE